MITSRILFRQEAVSFKQTLEPGTPLHEELEQALILKQGIQTLSSGIKVCTTLEEECLLGGVPQVQKGSHGTTLEIFQSIIKKANDLQAAIPRPIENRALRICRDIQRSIQDLIENTNYYASLASAKEKQASENLQGAVARYK